MIDRPRRIALSKSQGDAHGWTPFAGRTQFAQKFEPAGKIQAFLDNEVRYNPETTCRSPRRVIRDRRAHCAEGAFFAAAAMDANGIPPLIIDLEAIRDDDHLLAVFREHGRWGAVAQSYYAGLRFREPVYRTLRELVMSYYEHYFNAAGENAALFRGRSICTGLIV